ncbi:TonB-dependent receptor [Desulfoluna sp.]|uniref:TonB-dependent receptor n=1 Tax=Desulfoluna sp. TaxID=2045199 RepID=UPI002624E043|nr:TonB-dependent receptor [Desulfoluna sp.]
MKFLPTGMGVALLLCAATGLSWAADANDTPTLSLDEVRVEAKRPATISPKVLSRDQVMQPGMSDNLLDNLTQIPGIQLRRTAVSGNENGKLRMRGFDESRLRILKNGVPIQRDGSYGNGPVDWSTLNPNSIETVQVYKGAVPAKYGNTLGGVVDITTRSPEEGLETEIRGLYGSENTHEEALTHMGRNQYGSWFLSGGHYETDGFLRNNDTDRNHGEIDLSVNLPLGLTVGGGVCWSKYETGMPVYNRPDSPYYDGGEPDSDERELGGPGISVRLKDKQKAWGDDSFAEDENTRITAWIQKEFQKGHLRLNYLTWSQDKEETYVAADDPSKVIYKRETDAEPDNWSLQAEGEVALGDHTLEAGGETRSQGWGDQTVTAIDTSYFNGSINHSDLAFVKNGFKGQPDIMTYHALYLQDTWQLSDVWTLEAGLRQEWYKADAIDADAFGFEKNVATTDLSESNLDPRAALSFRPWKGGELSTRVGIVHRYPTSPEYFWWFVNRNESAFPNTSLTPEESRQVELALSQKFAEVLDVELRGYHYAIDDYITSTSIPYKGSMHYNIEEVTIQGAELSLRAPLPFNLSAWGNLTWQEGDKKGDPSDPENRLEGQVPDFPETMVNVGLDYRLDDRVSARLTLNHVDKREHIDAKTQEVIKLEAYTVVGASASALVFKNSFSAWRLMASVDNIFDEDYEEETGYPMPDTTYTVGVSATF